VSSAIPAPRAIPSANPAPKTATCCQSPPRVWGVGTATLVRRDAAARPRVAAAGAAPSERDLVGPAYDMVDRVEGRAWFGNCVPSASW
jgi:hypothetical protein